MSDLDKCLELARKRWGDKASILIEEEQSAWSGSKVYGAYVLSADGGKLAGSAGVTSDDAVTLMHTYLKDWDLRNG